MKISTALQAKVTVAAALFLAMPEVMATTVGMITHAPVSVSIPALGGPALVILSALLAMVSLRFLQARKESGGRFLVLATVVGALATGGSGLKLINDANANGFPYIFLTQQDGGVVDILVPGPSIVKNTSNSIQGITAINILPGYALFDFPLNAGDCGANGGTFQGTCSTSTLLADTECCGIVVCPPPVLNNGGFIPSNGAGNGATNAGSNGGGYISCTPLIR